MDEESLTVTTRRTRLREWFSTRPIPAKEKSYISQLLNGTAAFGEKAARRLEIDYEMGYKYLDTPANALIALAIEGENRRPSEMAMRVATAFDAASPTIQAFILRAFGLLIGKSKADTIGSKRSSPRAGSDSGTHGGSHRNAA